MESTDATYIRCVCRMCDREWNEPAPPVLVGFDDDVLTTMCEECYRCVRPTFKKVKLAERADDCTYV